MGFDMILVLEELDWLWNGGELRNCYIAQTDDRVQVVHAAGAGFLY